MSILQEGQLAPDFECQDEQDNTIRLSDFRGKANVILYFYPKDDTPGCTIEACNFRDDYSEFENLDTKIFGVSFDDAQSHQSFKEKFQLPFPLLVDQDHNIAQLFGVMGEDYPNRDTIVINKEGKIRKVIRSVSPKNHSKELIEIIKK